jgi:mono/diheme cytochrome c family protein
MCVISTRYKGLAGVILLTLCIIACKEDYTDGKTLYEKQCSACHGSAGQGLNDLIPPIAGSDWLTNPSYRAQLPCSIRKGMQGKILVNGKEYEGVMQAFPKLSDVDINNVLNYLATAWGNQAREFQITETRAALKKCE